jgi:hypothetical protein
MKRVIALWVAAGCTLGFGTSASRAAIVISSDATQNVRCANRVCKEQASDAVLNAAELTSMLANGDVKIVTSSLGKDIVVDAPLSWASASRLTFEAYGSITVGQSISVTGQGGLSLVTNSGGAGGDYLFTARGHIGFWDLGSKLVINGESFRLASGISGLAEAIQKHPAGNFAIAADYDASQDGTYSSAPIPTQVQGKVEGLGNTISHLTINDVSTAENTQTALFSSNAGTIRDIKVSGIQATGGYEGLLGGLVGLNTGVIQNVGVSGTIRGGQYTLMTGGVTALNNGNWTDNTAFVQNGSFNGKVTGRGDVGGIAGENYYALISGAYAAGAIDGKAAGGIAGSNFGGTISFSHSDSAISGHQEQSSLGGVAGLSTGPVSHCFATGAISNTGDFGGSNGGLIGENAGTIDSSFATGSVTGIGANGGVAGRSDNVALTNVYATGAVTHGSSTGGLVGESSYSSVNTAYSTGAVTLGTRDVGGAIGDGRWATSVYWDLDTSDISNPTRGCGSMPNCPGVTGLSDVQMKSGLPTGFDPTIWAQDPNINGGYPYLIELPPPAAAAVHRRPRPEHVNRRP